MSESIACIDYRNGKLFVAKRVNKGDMGNRWEFPGGKLDEGEDYIAAIKREMQEEFGVDVEVGNRIATTDFYHREKKCFLAAYLVHFAHDGIEKPFTLTEHTDYKWVLPEEIPSMNFVDSDLKIYPEVMKVINSLKK